VTLEQQPDTDALFTQLAELPAGDPRRESIRDELVRAHLPLARNLARKFRSRDESLDDLMQIATVGLINAVDRFDPSNFAGTFTSFGSAGSGSGHFFGPIGVALDGGSVYVSDLANARIDRFGYIELARVLTPTIRSVIPGPGAYAPSRNDDPLM